MASLIIKTIIIYFILIAAIRIMGKRQIGELEISELVITFLLSEFAVLPISNKNASMLTALVPIGILLTLELASSLLTAKIPAVRKLLIGKPNIIIRKGVIDTKELSRLRMSIAELMSELRLKGISSLAEIDYAIVEDNGQISVFKTASTSPATPSDIGIAVPERGIAHCVIAEGKVLTDGLSDAGVTREWLEDELKKRCAAIRDICIMTVDDGGNVLIIMKEK